MMKLCNVILGLVVAPLFLFGTGMNADRFSIVKAGQLDTAFVDTARASELYALGMQQRADDMVREAQKTFLRVVSLRPEHYAAQYELARASLEIHDFPIARSSAEIATQGQPGKKEYWELLLEVYRRMGDLAAMPAVFQALSKIEPDNPAHYYSEAYIHYVNKDYEAALAVYARAKERIGDTDDCIIGQSEVYMAMGKPEVAIKDLEAFLEQPPQTVRSHMLLAELYTLTQKPRRALSTLDVASERFPDEAVILLARADAYLAMGRERQAYDSLEKAFLGDHLDIEAKASVLYTTVSSEASSLSEASIHKLAEILTDKYAQDPRAHAIKGDIYSQLGVLDEARQAYLSALEINMYLEPVWQQLLQLELQMGMNDEVEKHGAEAAALFPNNHVVSFFTGHGMLANKKYVEARKLFENALNHAEQDNAMLMTQLYSSLGDVYNALEMHAESDVAYDEAILMDSTNAYALNNYAYYLALRKEKLERAESMAKRAVQLEPDVEHYEDTYAWVLFQLERYDDALVWIRRAMESAQEPSEVLYEHYGDILAMNGDIEKAVTQWKRARTVAEAVGKNIDGLSKKINERRYID